MELTLAIAIYGAILGTIGSLLGWLNFKRDRYKIAVALQWDAGQHHVGMRSNVIESWGHIYVTNVGRRPALITFVGLEIPGQAQTYSLLTANQSKGIKLAEGDPPLIFKIPQDKFLMEHAKVWKEIRASVTDSHNKHYKSRKVGTCPSWAKEGYEKVLAERSKRIEKIRQQELRALQTSHNTVTSLEHK